MAGSLETYGAKVKQVKADIGAAVTEVDLEKALKEKKYKVVTFTHVDTSTGKYVARQYRLSLKSEDTGVLSDAKMIGAVVKRVSPDTLVVLDGVCSVASEEIRMDDWGIDVVLSATQKGLGTPPGLSVVCASQRALKVSIHTELPAHQTYKISFRSLRAGKLPFRRTLVAGSVGCRSCTPMNRVARCTSPPYAFLHIFACNLC